MDGWLVKSCNVVGLHGAFWLPTDKSAKLSDKEPVGSMEEDGIGLFGQSHEVDKHRVLVLHLEKSSKSNILDAICFVLGMFQVCNLWIITRETPFFMHVLAWFLDPHHQLSDLKITNKLLLLAKYWIFVPCVQLLTEIVRLPCQIFPSPSWMGTKRFRPTVTSKHYSKQFNSV